MGPWHEQKVDLVTKALIGWILGLSFCLIRRWFHRRQLQLVNLQLKAPTNIYKVQQILTRELKTEAKSG